MRPCASTLKEPISECLPLNANKRFSTSLTRGFYLPNKLIFKKHTLVLIYAICSVWNSPRAYGIPNIDQSLTCAVENLKVRTIYRDLVGTDSRRLRLLWHGGRQRPRSGHQGTVLSPQQWNRGASGICGRDCKKCT